eukprot:CAMPEP_0179188180 /NCGR_PEP_ID=MMETSP0796-20121207/93393_1 /TAXON_ID=73915 /ORGANISM="Pyrodinium bahamense, Strain pbaha01" /LENGTH=215 /DNA_ID=CAMNT_0020892275 /DNA_START=229 /DNA_END=873 /DNA_ORIENTATION=-
MNDVAVGAIEILVAQVLEPEDARPARPALHVVQEAADRKELALGARGHEVQQRLCVRVLEPVPVNFKGDAELLDEPATVQLSGALESDETFPAEAIVEAAVEFEQNSSELSPRPCEVASELHSQSMSDCGKEELFFMVRSSSSLHTLPDSVWFRSSPQMVVGSVHPHSAILCMRRSSWLAGMVLSNLAGDSTSFQSSRAGKLQGSPICSCTRPPT